MNKQFNAEERQYLRPEVTSLAQGVSQRDAKTGSRIENPTQRKKQPEGHA
jgi:hypothetical protein